MAPASTITKIVRLDDDADIAAVETEINDLIEVMEASSWIAIDVKIETLVQGNRSYITGLVTFQLATVQNGQTVATTKSTVVYRHAEAGATKKSVSSYHPSPGAADADVSARMIFKAIEACRIEKITLLPYTASAGYAASPNDGDITFKKNDTDTLETQNFVVDFAVDTPVVFSTFGTPANAVFAIDDELTMDILQGTAADIEDMLVQVDYVATIDDLADRVIFKAPTALTITKITLMPLLASSGIAASPNDVDFVFEKNGSDALETQALVTDMVAGTDIAFETFNAPNAAFVLGDELTLTMTQNGVAVVNDYLIQIDYTAAA